MWLVNCEDSRTVPLEYDILKPALKAPHPLTVFVLLVQLYFTLNVTVDRTTAVQLYSCIRFDMCMRHMHIS